MYKSVMRLNINVCQKYIFMFEHSLVVRKFCDKKLIKMKKVSSASSSLINNRVLSIQSHVVFGYVGNKSATFPLQVLGFEVDAINSVQFSNHTGYKHIKGQILKEQELVDLYDGIKLNDLNKLYTHLLTGYIGNDSFLRRIGNVVKDMREANPNLIYVCDPVMGDNGEMYVPKELLPIYRDEIIPLADIVTPNQYEVELLTEKSIKTDEDAWKSLEWFHNKGVKTVVISSTDLGPSDSMRAFLSQKDGDTIKKFTLTIPKLGNGISFTGTGDLFAALFLAHNSLTSDVSKALENTTATLQNVIENTLESIVKIDKPNSKERELKLIQSKNYIEKPIVKLLAVKC